MENTQFENDPHISVKPSDLEFFHLIKWSGSSLMCWNNKIHKLPCIFLSTDQISVKYEEVLLISPVPASNLLWLLTPVHTNSLIWQYSASTFDLPYRKPHYLDCSYLQ
jgi:hypothetical protein